jgi:hypothetical protein
MKNKHILEFFRNDGWRVRLAVLVGHWAFSLAVIALCVFGGKGVAASVIPLIVGKIF